VLCPETHALKAAGPLWSHGPSAKLFVAMTALAAIRPPQSLLHQYVIT